MEPLLKKFAVLKTVSSKISAYLHKLDADPQEVDSDFDDEEWMESSFKSISNFSSYSAVKILL